LLILPVNAYRLSSCTPGMLVNRIAVHARANLRELIFHNRNSHGGLPHAAINVIGRYL